MRRISCLLVFKGPTFVLYFIFSSQFWYVWYFTEVQACSIKDFGKNILFQFLSLKMWNIFTFQWSALSQQCWLGRNIFMVLLQLSKIETLVNVTYFAVISATYKEIIWCEKDVFHLWNSCTNRHQNQNPCKKIWQCKCCTKMISCKYKSEYFQWEQTHRSEWTKK